MATPHHYPISVVIPTMNGWPRMSISLQSVLPQLLRTGSQLVADTWLASVIESHRENPAAALTFGNLIALLHLSRASGEAIGLVSGASDSGRHLRQVEQLDRTTERRRP